jgi:transposase
MPPSTPPRKCAVYLTRDQRIQARTLRSVSFTYEAIAKHLSITIRQAQHACKAEQATPSKRVGRPSILSEAQVDELIDHIRQDRQTRRMSYSRLAKEVFPQWEVGEYAIRSALRRRGFKRYIALAKPPLSEANKIKRYTWTEEHVNWSKE